MASLAVVPPTAPSDDTINVLCLHGNRQTAVVFENRLKKLISALQSYQDSDSGKSVSVHFDFCDAPYELELQVGDAVPLRTWRRDSESWDRALETVEKVWNAGTSAGKPFHGLFGFSQGACVAAMVCSEEARFVGLQFAIMASGLSPDISLSPSSLTTPSMHVYGMTDNLVRPKESILLSRLFVDPVLYAHAKNHQVCQRSESINAIAVFLIRLNLQSVQTAKLGPFDLSEEVADELEALSSIYMGDGEYCLINKNPPVCTVSVQAAPDKDQPRFTLRFSIGKDYPTEVPCHIDIIDATNMSAPLMTSLQIYLTEMALENLGAPMVYSLSELAREWIVEHVEKLEDAEVVYTKGFSNEDEVQHVNLRNEILTEVEESLHDDYTEEMDEMLSEVIHEASNAGIKEVYFSSIQKGRWSYCIGLVGKPSAGKSTYFNGAINVNNKPAIIGAYPFTTIEPNFGFTNIPIRHPRPNLKGKSEEDICSSEITVRLKDVAGLVPGAYKGRGKGNKFLNDLLDADVLVHVVDASGETDANGNFGGYEGNPVEDIVWISKELHRWVYGNVASKWSAILRRPKKFLSMFSGYNATPDFIQKAVERAGIGFQTIESSLSTWTKRTLHLIVAHFIELRFPIFLALNKIDKPSAQKNLESISKMYPSSRFAPVAARVSWLLKQWQKNHVVTLNNDGQSTKLVVVNECAAKKVAKEIEEVQAILKRCGPQNILLSIEGAMRMRWPKLVFPVTDLDSECLGLASKKPFGDCVPFLHGSTVEDVHAFLSREGLLVGEFVRAEILTETGVQKLVRKTDMLSEVATVIKISTNRRRHWQNQQLAPKETSDTTMKKKKNHRKGGRMGS
jgi:ribosome-binding ATPase